MVRSLNWKLLLGTAAALLAGGFAVYLTHEVQVHRSAGSFLEYADEARALAAQAAEAGDRSKEAEQLSKALTYYQHYLSIEPKDTSALIKYALILDQKAGSPNDRDLVIAKFEEILQNDPRLQNVRERLFLRLVQEYRTRDAITHMQTLLSQGNGEPSKRADWEHKLGWCLEACAEYPKAVDAFARAAELDPHRIESYVIWANVLQNRLNRPEDAGHVMDAMISANGQSFAAYLARAKFLRLQQQFGRAETDVDKALALAPQAPEVFLAAGELAYSRGDIAQARVWLQKGRALAPTNVGLLRALAWLEVRTGNAAEAEQILESMLERQPDIVDLRFLLAELLHEEGKLAQAEAHWLQIAHAHPDDLPSRFALFESALHGNQLDKARALAADLRELEGDQGKYWQLATAELLLPEAAGHPDRLADIRKRLEQLARRQQSWGRIALLRAQIEEQEGNQDKAVTFYLQALDLGERKSVPSLRLLRLLVQFQRYLDAEKVVQLLKDQLAVPWQLRRFEAELALADQNAAAAERLAAAAVPPDSNDYRDALWLGQIYHGVGTDAKAEAALRRAVSLAPQTPDTWIALTQQLTRMGRRDQAQTVAQEALQKVAPATALFTEARCADVMGSIDRAATLYKQALAQNTDDFSLLMHGADFFRHGDNPEMAEPFLRALLKLAGAAPADYLARARRQLAAILAAKGPAASAEALALLDENSRLRPNQPADVRARAFVKIGSSMTRRQVIAVFESTAKRQPLSADEQFQLAQLYVADGDIIRAEEQVATLLTQQPDNPQFLAFQLRHLIDQMELNQARARLRRLEMLEPDSERTRKLKRDLARAS